VIESFGHSGIESFFETGSKAGIQPRHAARLALQLFALDSARHPLELNAPGWNLHPLRGPSFEAHWALSVSGNWRLIFAFQGEDAVLVDYRDYH